MKTLTIIIEVGLIKKQVIEIEFDQYDSYNKSSKQFVKDAIAYVFQTNIKTKEKIIYPIYLGSQVVSQKVSIRWHYFLKSLKVH